MVEARYETILSTIGHITFYAHFFIPIPYIHTLRNIMGGQTKHCRIWTSVIFFSFKTIAKFIRDF